MAAQLADEVSDGEEGLLELLVLRRAELQEFRAQIRVNNERLKQQLERPVVPEAAAAQQQIVNHVRFCRPSLAFTSNGLYF